MPLQWSLNLRVIIAIVSNPRSHYPGFKKEIIRNSNPIGAIDEAVRVKGMVNGWLVESSHSV
jgi:hypothetical protein